MNVLNVVHAMMALQDGGKRYGYQPRCARMKTFHQFVWSLVYSSDSPMPVAEATVSSEDKPDTIVSFFATVQNRL